MTWRVIEGDCREVLRSLAGQSVHTCVTSPPYFSLRDYGHDGQIGLEPSPDEFVAALVGVFREVRRVLRHDGTAWLNLGDSYAAQGGGKAPGLYEDKRADGATWQAPRSAPSGVKPKDLLGIPWLVAFALRQPYYDGTIKDERGRVWLAAMIDAEGSVDIAHNRAGSHRRRDSYGSSLKVHNTCRAVVERCAEIAGCGSVKVAEARRQTVYVWAVYGDEARRVLREVYPHLIAKQHQARLASSPATEGARDAIQLLHRGSDATVDVPAPSPCWTPGWYLRSEIIWHKPNPMPESVTDRPTKAHEQIFLLSKRPSYFYDADAVREADTGVVRPNFDGQRGTLPGSDGRSAVGGDALDRAGTHPAGRNKRTVWTVASAPYAGAHFATFPPKLIKPCILAGCPEGGTVLDPFAGAGTTGMVALRHGRSFVGIELSAEYARLARERIVDDCPLHNAGIEAAA